MIVQIAPVEKNVNETLASLNFAQRVRCVELGAASKHVENGDSKTNGEVRFIISCQASQATVQLLYLLYKSAFECIIYISLMFRNLQFMSKGCHQNRTEILYLYHVLR